MQHLYLIALGGNRPHHRFGPPAKVLKAACEALEKLGKLRDIAPIIETAPLGPSKRRFANSAVLLETRLAPPALLDALKTIERDFGSRRGQSWSARTLDLDIILWSGGVFASNRLIIPHRLFRTRDFVLSPAGAMAPGWRDPLTGLTLAQLWARLTKPKGKRNGHKTNLG